MKSDKQHRYELRNPKIQIAMKTEIERELKKCKLTTTN